MPTYDYRCSSCNHEFTVICRIAEMNEPKVCPVCQSPKSEKFLGGAPVMGDAHRLGVTRSDNGFKEVLSRIHEKTPGSRLKDNANF